MSYSSTNNKVIIKRGKPCECTWQGLSIPMSFLEAISRPAFRTVADFWADRLEGGTAAPVRKIDPTRIDPNLLPWLFLFQREAGGRFRCLLVGTGITGIDGYDSTGMYLEQLRWIVNKNQQIELFEEVSQSALPIVYNGIRVVRKERARRFSRLLLPACSVPGKVDHVFGLLQVETVQPDPANDPMVGPRSKSLNVVRARMQDVVTLCAPRDPNPPGIGFPGSHGMPGSTLRDATSPCAPQEE